MASVVRLARLNIPCTKFITGQVTCMHSQRHYSNRASIKRSKEEYHLRTYESVLVHPDGSSVRIKFEEPRLLLKIPAHTTYLTRIEKIQRLRGLGQAKKIEINHDVIDDYDVSSYSKMMKDKSGSSD